MAIQKVRCPHCKREIPDLAQELHSLKKEIAKLQRQVGELEGEVRYLGGTVFVASARRKKFHRLDCIYVPYFTDDPGRCIVFRSHQAAIDEGYKPCGTCCA